MTFFTEVNEDAKSVAPDQVATGPRVGFMESFNAAYDAQVRASAQNGMWAAYADAEDEQLRAMKEAGIENMPRIGLDAIDMSVFGDVDFFRYREAARFYDGGGSEADANRLKEYDTRIQELRNQYPDLSLKTGRELFDDVVRKGREAEKLAEGQRRTFSGSVGAFIGGAAASMNPRTDEFNFLTMGVGGPGRTAAARIASEAGLQGGIELVNQMTGVQEQRAMMGLSTGAGDVISRVAGTALVGGTIQGVGEGLAVAGRRWFGGKTEDIPAPPVEPSAKKDTGPLLLEYKPPEWEGQAAWEADVKEYQQGVVRDLIRGARDYTQDLMPLANVSKTRRGEARARLDIDYVSSRLDAWDGELPYQIKPKTATSIPSRVDPNFKSEWDIHAPGTRVDAIARENDPRLFSEYDKLASRKATFQQWLQDPRYKAEQTATVSKAMSKIEELSTSIENLKRNMTRVGTRRRAEMQKKLDGLEAERSAAKEQAVIQDTPAMARIRRELMDTDERMRDMYPEVSRAYAHAKGLWDLGAADREAVMRMIKEGKTTVPEADAALAAKIPELGLESFARTLDDAAPILKQRNKVEASMEKGADAADIAQAILKVNQKVIDDALSVYRDSLDQIIKAEKDGIVTINGERFQFNLDKDTIYVPLEDGTGSKRVTIRELLEDNADTEAQMKAMQTCSIV